MRISLSYSLAAVACLLLIPAFQLDGGNKASAVVETYGWSSTIPTSGRYTVMVDGRAQKVIPTEEPHVCQFGCSDSVEVTISLLNSRVRSAAVRPLGKKAAYSVSSGRLILRMSPYDHFVVELNGKKDNPLFIFANPLEEKPARETCAYYFEAGTVTDTTVRIKTGKVYIEGGAWVNGEILAFKAADVEIGGYGILNGMGRERPVYIRQSRNVGVDGLLLINHDMWSTYAVETDNISFTNYKVVAPASNNGFGHENDALDILGCQNVRIRKCFTYCHDDALCIKSQKWAYGAPVRNVVCEDCIIWNHLCGSGLEIGWETNQDCSDVHFKDIWCVRSGGNMRRDMYRAGISVKHCGAGHLSNFTFENIYVEDALEYGIFFGIYKSVANIGNKVEWKPGTMEGFTFRNIHIDGPAPYGSASVGYDAGAHSIKGVIFEDLFINGKKAGPDPKRTFHFYKNSDIVIR